MKTSHPSSEPSIEDDSYNCGNVSIQVPSNGGGGGISLPGYGISVSLPDPDISHMYMGKVVPQFEVALNEAVAYLKDPTTIDAQILTASKASAVAS